MAAAAATVTAKGFAPVAAVLVPAEEEEAAAKSDPALMTAAKGSPPPRMRIKLSRTSSIFVTKAGSCRPKVEVGDPSMCLMGSKRRK